METVRQQAQAIQLPAYQVFGSDRFNSGDAWAERASCPEAIPERDAVNWCPEGRVLLDRVDQRRGALSVASLLLTSACH